MHTRAAHPARDPARLAQQLVRETCRKPQRTRVTWGARASVRGGSPSCGAPGARPHRAPTPAARARGSAGPFLRLRTLPSSGLAPFLERPEPHRRLLGAVAVAVVSSALPESPFRLVRHGRASERPVSAGRALQPPSPPPLRARAGPACTRPTRAPGASGFVLRMRASPLRPSSVLGGNLWRGKVARSFPRPNRRESSSYALPHL